MKKQLAVEKNGGRAILLDSEGNRLAVHSLSA